MLDLIWGVLRPAFSRTILTFTLPDGSRFRYPLGSRIGFALFLLHRFEQAETQFIRAHLRPGDTFIDVGANAGLHTVMAARIVGPAGHVYAFEPSQREVALLRENIGLNTLTNVTVVECAVSDTDGTAELAIARDGGLNTLGRAVSEPSEPLIAHQQVRTIRLDTFLHQTGVRQVDFIKIDVEGAERLVFAGARQLLADDRPLTVLFETSDASSGAFGYCRQELLAELAAADLVVCHLDAAGRPRPATPRDVYVEGEVVNHVAFSRAAGESAGWMAER